jgi:hypothetical protein
LTTKWLDKEVLVPYIITRPPRRALALAAACLGLLVAAAPAAANGKPQNPADQVSKPVFGALGDSADYFALTGGTFETDTADWSLTGAQVVPGNEPFQVDGLGDSHSLSIAPGGVAVSPAVTINNTTPTWRFFADAADASSTATQLTVYAQWTNPNTGRTFRLPIARRSAKDHAKWAATPALLLGKYLPAGVNVDVQFVFQAAANGGTWTIDDVFIDPYAR